MEVDYWMDYGAGIMVAPSIIVDVWPMSVLLYWQYVEYFTQHAATAKSAIVVGSWHFSDLALIAC